VEAPRRLALSLVAAVTVAAAGCRSLDRFETEAPAAYCGAMVGAPQFHEGFVPAGAPPTLSLRLDLDMSSLTTRPGVLTSNDGSTGFCSNKGRPLFEEASLRAIPQISNDTLSQLDFGEGHDHDFFAWVDSTCQGTMLAVISLLKNDAVEVRLLKPAADPPPTAGPEKQPGFALFYLLRHPRGCTF
jgi:hypothetical protein